MIHLIRKRNHVSSLYNWWLSFKEQNKHLVQVLVKFLFLKSAYQTSKKTFLFYNI